MCKLIILKSGSAKLIFNEMINLITRSNCCGWNEKWTKNSINNVKSKIHLLRNAS